MNRAAKGRRLEHKTMKRLEAIGYACTRSSASKGVWDVIAIRGQDIRLIQVKANRPPPPAERDSMQEFRAPDVCSKEFWVWKDREREPHIFEFTGGKWE